jgi:hypothetical protein
LRNYTILPGAGLPGKKYVGLTRIRTADGRPEGVVDLADFLFGKGNWRWEWENDSDTDAEDSADDQADDRADDSRS